MLHKVALIIAGFNQSIDSFRCKDGNPYLLDYAENCGNIIYKPKNAVRNIYNLPRPFDDGLFIKWTTSKDLIDIDLDAIFLVIEESNCNNYNINIVRKVYPNALIIGYFKEKNPICHSPKNRIDFLKSCDCVATPYRGKFVILDKEAFSFPYPYTLSDFSGKINEIDDRVDDIFLGGNWWNPIRGYLETKEFVTYLSNKYGYSVLNYKQRYGTVQSWKYWLEAMARCRICINLDPMPEIGQEAIECAAMGVVHIGSNLDAHHRLFDSITNKDKIEKNIVSLLSNNDFYKESTTKAFDKFQLHYSFKAARKNLEAILDGQ